MSRSWKNATTSRFPIELLTVNKHVFRISALSNPILGGQLVFCAFSGSHQDAIKKGFGAREASGAKDFDLWQIPYLPLDPLDIGRSYEAIIRVNSQSGKGGAAFIILRNLNLDLPRNLQVDFSRIVQQHADQLSRELKATEIIALFKDAYLPSKPRFELIDFDIAADRSASPAPGPGNTPSSKHLKRIFRGVIAVDGHEKHVTGVGNGAISSLANALQSLGPHLHILDYKEHAIGAGKESKAATYIECSSTIGDSPQQKVWGVGIHNDVVQASLIALLNAASSIPH